MAITNLSSFAANAEPTNYVQPNVLVMDVGFVPGNTLPSSNENWLHGTTREIVNECVDKLNAIETDNTGCDEIGRINYACPFGKINTTPTGAEQNLTGSIKRITDSTEALIINAPIDPVAGPTEMHDYNYIAAALPGIRGAWCNTDADSDINGCAAHGRHLIVTTSDATKAIGVTSLSGTISSSLAAVTWYTFTQLTGVSLSETIVDEVRVSGDYVFVLWRRTIANYTRYLTRIAISADGILSVATGENLVITAANTSSNMIVVSDDTVYATQPGELNHIVKMVFNGTSTARTYGTGGLNPATYVSTSGGIAYDGDSVYFVVVSASTYYYLHSAAVSDLTTVGSINLVSFFDNKTMIDMAMLGGTADTARLYYLSRTGTTGAYIPKITAVAPNLSGSDFVVANVDISGDILPVNAFNPPMYIIFDGLKLWFFSDCNGVDSVCAFSIDPCRIHELTTPVSSLEASTYTIDSPIALRFPGQLSGRPFATSNDILVPTTTGIKIIRGSKWR